MLIKQGMPEPADDTVQADCYIGTKRVIIPIAETERRQATAEALELARSVQAKYLNPDEPLRYEPPSKPVRSRPDHKFFEDDNVDWRVPKHVKLKETRQAT